MLIIIIRPGRLHPTCPPTWNPEQGGSLNHQISVPVGLRLCPFGQNSQHLPHSASFQQRALGCGLDWFKLTTLEDKRQIWKTILLWDFPYGTWQHLDCWALQGVRLLRTLGRIILNSWLKLFWFLQWLWQIGCKVSNITWPRRRACSFVRGYAGNHLDDVQAFHCPWALLAQCLTPAATRGGENTSRGKRTKLNLEGPCSFQVVTAGNISDWIQFCHCYSERIWDTKNTRCSNQTDITHENKCTVQYCHIRA